MSDRISDQQREHFDLSEFVLGYLEEQGSVVMPPAFGIYDVLMPDEVADRFGLADYARLAFAPPAAEQAADEALRLSVNHPLVESIAQTVTRQPANARAYINGVRTDKRGLAELASKRFSLPNARLDPIAKAQEEAVQHHYLLCNFKVAFVSEEKQEELTTVVMDVQAGHAVQDADILRRLEIVDIEPDFGVLPVASAHWLGAGVDLAADTLPALWPRAERALRQRLVSQVATLTARMERHLALDLARISDYYDELATDLKRRQARLAADDSAPKGPPRQGHDDKVAALEAERAAKLQDVRARYGVRVEIELVNVLLVAQPKVMLPVTISNRTATITRTVVWDPLVHRLEPLVCDVCGEPGEGLHLCTGGHLAHAACLAPQCIDCKRAFCQLCAAQVTECVVCQRPVCQPSLITCSTCGRGTCREHQQLCHAANGQPATLPEVVAPPPVSKLSPVALPPMPPKSAKPAAKPLTKSPPVVVGGRGKAKPPALPPPAPSNAPMTKGVRINIEIHELEPTVVAFVMRSTHGVLATRSFTLTPKGILVHCQCEKADCKANGYYHRPAAATAITEQIESHLNKLQQEYLIPAKKVHYYFILGNQVREEKRFGLPDFWRDAEGLAEAQRGFDQFARG